MAKTVSGHARGDMELVGQPIRMSRTPSGMALPPPDYGEHTEEILQEIGLSGEEISKLREEDII
jgi:crotonobetainyl-CoA:carnitine CoA-transferase CaiB-like acyl-CoA transferase